MLQPIFQQQLPKVIEQLKKHKVKRAFVFGSVCTDKFNEESDLDFLIYFNEIPLLEYADNYFGLKEKLEDLFGRKVDLVEGEVMKNPYFIKSVNNSKQLIYG
jgi:predicted nucleotidyltransferase